MDDIERLNRWIFESPDNGKTIIRRLTSRYGDDHKEINVDDDGSWLTLTELRHIGKQHVQESAMRAKHPQLMELWKSYQVMLALIKEESDGRE